MIKKKYEREANLILKVTGHQRHVTSMAIGHWCVGCVPYSANGALKHATKMAN